MKSIGPFLSGLAGLAMIMGDASAQQYTRHLEQIEIPTDLVAPVSRKVDSISGSTGTLPATDQDQPVVTTEQEPEQGSIFSDLDAVEPVSQETEPATEVAAMDNAENDNKEPVAPARTEMAEQVHEDANENITGNVVGVVTGEDRLDTGEEASVASGPSASADGDIFSGLAPDRPDPSPAPELPVPGQGGETSDGVSPGEQEIATADTASAQPVADAGPPPVSDPPQADPVNEDVIISSWANAWSNNDVEAYLDYYARDFDPADPAMDRDDWEQIRRERLKNENIRIIVSNAELVSVAPGLVEVQFTQRYTSKHYRDRIIKAIEMKQTEDGWKFVSERTVEKLPFE